MKPLAVRIAAPCERVFDVLGDPRAIAYVVPGARTIRRFDPRWPETGTAVQHSVGIWPLVIRDTTVVLDCEPPRRLVLEARLRLLGTLRISFALEGDGETDLWLGEEALAGLATRPGVRVIAEHALGLRNRELCRRLRRLCERRERQRRVEGLDG